MPWHPPKFVESKPFGRTTYDSQPSAHTCDRLGRSRALPTKHLQIDNIQSTDATCRPIIIPRTNNNNEMQTTGVPKNRIASEDNAAERPKCMKL